MPHPKFATGGLRAFFERFQSLTASDDAEAIAGMYAESVMIAGPQGAQVVTSTDLQRAIPKRRQLLASVGHQDTALVGFEESALGDRYALVRAQFRWRFQAGRGERAPRAGRAAAGLVSGVPIQIALDDGRAVR